MDFHTQQPFPTSRFSLQSTIPFPGLDMAITGYICTPLTAIPLPFLNKLILLIK